MSDVWGLMPKAQDDDETIEEAIARLIAEHEADEAAHLGVGEALQSHKASEIIDHAAESIVDDKLALGVVKQYRLSGNEIQLFFSFESLDGWTHNITAGDQKILGTIMQTGTTINNVKYLHTEPAGTGDIHNYGKKTFFQVAMQFNSVADVLAYIVTGEDPQLGDAHGFGFTVQGGKIYAVVYYEGDEYKTEIVGATPTAFHVYRCLLDPAAAKIYYYIDNVLVHTQTEHIPGDTVPTLVSFYIKNLAAANKYVALRNFFFSREY